MTTPPQDPYRYPTFSDQPPPAPAQQPPQPPKRRRWPWVVGIMAALVIGVGIGTAGEDPPPAAAAGDDQEARRLQAALDDTQERLEDVADQRDAALEDLDEILLTN